MTINDPEATFHAVELGQAMLCFVATDAGIPLGSGESIDLASVVKLDAMSETQEYAIEQDITFRAEGGEAGEPVVFHAWLKIAFTPSPKDQREELYEMLNKASTKKAQAVEKLRQTALAASRQTGARKAEASGSSAVKAGFLNKTKKTQSGIKVVFDKWFGPSSIIRQVYPIAKNYVIFFAAVAVFHYKGDALALPPPV